MYRALTINEIQSEILSYLSNWNDLFSAAVSCKTLSDNALRVLWTAPLDLGCLIHTMPSDLWTHDRRVGRKHACLKFTRALSETDWDRFDYYAPMIRVMKFKTRIFPEKGFLYDNVSVQLRVYKAFNVYASMHNRISFLPSLHSAIFVDDKDYPFSLPPLTHLGCFLSSKLRSLELKTPVIFPETVAKMVIQKSPNITSLTADLRANLDQFLFSVDPPLSNLTTISGDLRVDTRTGEHLGALPLLKSVKSLTVGSDDQFSPFTTEGGRFPSLIDLQLETLSLKKTGRLLGRLQCGFKTLHIISTHHFTNPKLSYLTAAIGSNSQLHTSLTKLTISTTNAHFMDVEVAPVEDPYRPLRLLKALEHLVIKVSGIRLHIFNNAWLAECALAWPNIQSLVIATSDSNFTLKGLVPLITHCRNINHIDLNPYVTDIDPSLLPRDGSATNHNIKGALSLREPECNVDPPAVFACIKVMLPNVTEIKLDPYRSSYLVNAKPSVRQQWAELEGFFKEGQAKSDADELVRST